MRRELLTLDGVDVPYLYGADCTGELQEALAAEASSADGIFFVMDSRVTTHATPLTDRLARDMPVTPFVIDAEEKQKTLSLVESILEHAIERGATRSSIVMAMGGGMVCNVAGLAASLMYRGVRLVHLPTTPVAAFDTVVSIKQAVNLRGGKNLCGTYYAPSLITCDLEWLATVPLHEMFTGLAEMVKNVLAVLPDHEGALVEALRCLPEYPHDALLTLLDIARDAKAPILRDDPRERKQAIVFEYGHTMGHALEFTSRGTMSHGEAVAWGLLVAAEVSRTLGHLSNDDVDRHYRVIERLRLPDPRARLGGVDRQSLRETLAADNKQGYVTCADDEVPMVLLAGPGDVLVGSHDYPLVPVAIEVVLAALDTVIASADRRPVSPRA